MSSNMNRTIYDKIIIGAGLYGLYAADYAASRGDQVLILEWEAHPFMRATYINQARVHMGYHYPRSLTTALKSAGYFNRFMEDYAFCVHTEFDQIYATSYSYSWTNAEQFVAFCEATRIPCEELSVKKYFNEQMVDGAFLTKEYTYDAHILMEHLYNRLKGRENVTFLFQARIKSIEKKDQEWQVSVLDEASKEQHLFHTPYILNATYASTNQILSLVHDPAKTGDCYKPFPIKYELCEIVLCNPSPKLSDIGFTVMDGPFFSIMPFGKTGYHSLTAVAFTPHETSYDVLPAFKCQKDTTCTPAQLENCSNCIHRPTTAWPYMDHLAQKYIKPEYQYTYAKSLYSMKPILKSSEVDDSRPTRIQVDSTNPTFISVLSGKINTVYDLDEYL